MVLTKLHDMVSSVSDWTHGKRQVNASMKPSNSSASRAETSSEVFRHASNDSYWNYANDKIKGAAEDAYSSIADMVSNALYTDGSVNLFGSKSFRSTKRNWDSYLSATQDDFYSARLSNLETPRRSALKRSSSISARELAIMFKNPYEHVRGRHSHQSSSSVSAIRSLLTLVPQTMSHPQSSYHLVRSTSADGVQAYNDMDDSWTATCTPHKDNRINDLPANVHPPFVSSAETASQIAEGTVRALRDLALDEAVELHNSLRFWSERWERPLLSWLEAGPGVWMRPGGYNHQAVGRKVAQIQAILARRCASIGELQTHLLRAGWHKGVAQWGVLGDGGQWAAVSGFDGFTADAEKHQDAGRSRTRTLSNVDVTVSQKTKASKDEFAIAETSGRQALPPTIESIFSGHSEANIFVQKFAGGGLVVDDPAFLSEWSVIGIKLVRQQLSRSMGGAEHLPYDNHWTSSSSHDREDFFVPAAKSSAIPCWASVTTSPVGLTEGPNDEHTEVSVIDLPAMIVEVSELVEVMEPIMNMQRRRRLDKLQPPSWIRRNWFVMASAGPVISYLGYQLLRNNNAKATYRQLTQKVRHFCRERIQEPIAAIIQELWKGRAPFSDREARLEAIESLKKMIRNWLDENYPDLPLDKREALAAKMDVTLIEKQKVESMKTFYEINKVIQMSFIEMQYMKKEMLNALEAIDQMMSANDINMNVAAVTPVAMLVYAFSRVFHFLYFALLKIGKSREDTYAALRSILTDVERLLVMRDNPPQPPPLPERQKREYKHLPLSSTVLNPDDLGMLMLLLHGARQILWKERRRFRSETIRSMSEDLAELAGERGPVSVQQQLLILSRMSRTYPFLKVVSTGNVSSSGLI